MDHITIRAFRAVDDRETCVRYILEHARVLSDIGVTSVIKPDDSWIHDPTTIVFAAEHPELGLVAGIKLERAKHDKRLPMEASLTLIEPGLGNVLAPYIEDGNAELGGLWNAHRFAGRGVPGLLIAAAVSMANQLSLRSMVCLVAEYVAPYCSLNGFLNIEEVGDHGQFVFPIPSIRSYAMRVPDTHVLENAHDGERKRAMSLRMRPQQSRIEHPKKEQLLVHYDLLLNRDLPRYRELVLNWHRPAA